MFKSLVLPGHCEGNYTDDSSTLAHRGATEFICTHASSNASLFYTYRYKCTRPCTCPMYVKLTHKIQNCKVSDASEVRVP